MEDEKLTQQLHEHALREAETLCQVVEEISSEVELRPLLTRIVTHACELLGADDGAIGLVDPSRRKVRTEANYHMPMQEQGAETPINVGLTGAVLARGEPLILDRYGDLPDITLPELAENAVIGVPIKSHGRLVGVFGIGARPPRKFNQRDLATLQLFARHAAIAIDNAIRYQREKSRSERLALIARVSRLVSAGLEPVELVATAAQVIHEQLGYPNVAIPLLEKEFLVYRPHAGAYREIFSEHYQLHVTQGITGAAVRTRRVVVVNDITQDARYVPPPKPIDVTSELAVPIVLGHEVFGVVNVEGRVPFEKEDISSIQVIADHLAVAIKNARLFDEAREAAIMRERQKLARDLHDSVTQVLSSISLMSQSLVAAWNKDAKEGERRAHRLEELSRLAFAEMRALLAELRPLEEDAHGPPAEPGSLADVASYGLKRALQRVLAVLAPDTLDVHVDFTNYPHQALEHEQALCRICQEAIANSLRHSSAQRLSVSATTVGTSRVRVEIADDGQGFDPVALEAACAPPGSTPAAAASPALAARRGLGMQTMRERAAALGGITTIHSQRGQGTRVVIELPRRDR